MGQYLENGKRYVQWRDATIRGPPSLS